jgi:hypothetical protein
MGQTTDTNSMQASSSQKTKNQPGRAQVRLITASLVILATSFTTTASAAFYNFAAQGSALEDSYSLFNTDDGINTDSILPPGIEISASNGGALSTNPFNSVINPDDHYAYFDGHWKQDAGLGVCQSPTNSCGSDDNQMEGEYIHMDFTDGETEIISLNITGDHTAVADGARLWYSLDDGLNWNGLNIGGETMFTALSVGWVTELSSIPLFI